MLHLPNRQNQNRGDLVLGRLRKYRFSPLYRLASSARTAYLYVVGLSGKGKSKFLEWCPHQDMVQLAQAQRRPPRASVVGCGPHVDLNLRQRALDAGCDAVVGRSAVANSTASLLERYAWRPDRSACDGSLPAGVLKGVEQFNRREFYACHDSIELVWVDEPGDVRLMYQGLLQISVAFYHVQKGN